MKQNTHCMKTVINIFHLHKEHSIMALNKLRQNVQILKTGVVQSLAAKFTSHLKYPFRLCIKNTNYLQWLIFKCMFQREYNWHNEMLLAKISAKSISNNYQWNCPHTSQIGDRKNSKFIQVTKCVHSALTELLRILNFVRETMNEEDLSCSDVINRQEIARSEVLTAVPLETSLPERYVVTNDRH
jgi:hypothetical protein